MRIEIAPGCSVRLGEHELIMVNRVRSSGHLLQDNLTPGDMSVIISLVNKNVLRRRNQQGAIRYEVRPGINW